MKIYLAVVLTGLGLVGCGNQGGTADGVPGELMHPASPEVVAKFQAQQAARAAKQSPSEEETERDYPVPPEKLAEIKNALAEEMEDLNRRIGGGSENPNLYSRRGDAYFFEGAFKKAAGDFDREVELEPGRLRSHWRRGIALYYARRYQESADQFAKYHEQDSHAERENGIWHFLANAGEVGIDEARAKMLVYEKEDSHPVMQQIYALHAGQATADEVLEGIESSGLNAGEKEQQGFFAHAYIGWLSAVEKDLERAKHHLFQAVANQWGQNAGGAPGYMWHTARVHYDVLIHPVE